AIPTRSTHALVAIAAPYAAMACAAHPARRLVGYSPRRRRDLHFGAHASGFGAANGRLLSPRNHSGVARECSGGAYHERASADRDRHYAAQLSRSVARACAEMLYRRLATCSE